MKGRFSQLFLALALLSANTGFAAVEYVKICDNFGAGFHNIPGTDICLNEETGQTREFTAGPVWFSLLPTDNQGHWVNSPRQECAGRVVKLGPYAPSDFKINASGRYQVAPVAFKLQAGEFISKVMMNGGFSDPFQPLSRNPQLSPHQFCLRVADPTFVVIDQGGTPSVPPFCTASPLGCASNSLLLGVPGAYSFPVAGAPTVHYNTDINGLATGSPATCGSQLVVTTGMGPWDPTTTSDPSQVNTPIPAAGALSVWACVEQGVSQVQ